MCENARPNLFDYAKKELSQDAMICWLIRWADERFAQADRALHKCGREFVLALLREHRVKSLPDVIETKVFQQDKSIDVLARVSPDHVLLIEDKTGTKDHGGQLKRYYEHVVEGRTRLGKVRDENVFPIYLKTGNQSRHKDRKIEGATQGFYRPYRVFNRSEFLHVLRSYEGNHETLIDFRNYLECRELRTKSFQQWEDANRSEWSWESWEGFYRYLEKTLDTGFCNWNYVANPSGGFLGFHWSFIGVNGNGAPEIFLQLEASPKHNRHLLCFKVHKATKPMRQDLKWKWYKRIRDAGGGKVVRPPVMRAGWSMTVGHWEGEWLMFTDRKIDLAGTVENLKAAEEIMLRAAGQPS